MRSCLCNDRRANRRRYVDQEPTSAAAAPNNRVAADGPLRGPPLNRSVRRTSKVAQLVHELWIETDQEQTFCLAGPMGDDARSRMAPGAQKVWTIEAESHFDAMSKYYAHMGWGAYTTEHAWDFEPYPDEWLQIQRAALR
jgi:hypothetical protein